ncbi:hypothetical protein TrRE_jg2006 [Triparma retinervis]|uniref:Flavin-containing monooxygenase n=1 Tax=Triparma retinervis TaxID=2557542 RepID=A0A9W7AYK4_9STRA|nr:hypothetical protein TrRE_jg2006 [Triparma retinervis]
MFPSSSLFEKWAKELREQKYAFIPGKDMLALLHSFGATPASISPSTVKSLFPTLPVNPSMSYKFAAESSVLLTPPSTKPSPLPVLPFVLYADDMSHPDGLEGVERLYASLPPSYSTGPLMSSFANLSNALLHSFRSTLPPNSPSLLPPAWDHASPSLVVKQWPARTVLRASDSVGEPSPEGVHQDGCELGCITFVDRDNVLPPTGANRVWGLEQPVGKAGGGDRNLLDGKVLGEYFDTFVFLDRHVKHEATAFEARDEGRDATRDVIVTFARRPRKDGGDFGRGGEKGGRRGFMTRAGGGGKRVAVVGGGPSAMAVINAVSKLEDPRRVEVTVFERQEEWGGMWNYDWRVGSDERGRAVGGSMYQQLWSNSAKETNEMLDYGYVEHFGGPTPSYLPREMMRDYIVGRVEKAMREEGVKVDVRFGEGVERVEWDEEKGGFGVWGDGREESEEFDNVIVASGHFSVPSSVSFPGFSDFNGRIMHSTDFRNALEFAGRKVVIVGNGNSGEDIALQCHKYGAEEVKLTYRTERSKIKWPSGIEEIPNLARVGGPEGRTCYFKDGSSVDGVDAIVLCTGYKHSFPFMDRDLKLETPNNLYPKNLYKGVAWVDNPALYYMGMQDIWIGLKVYDCQAFWVVDNILGGAGGGVGREARERDIEGWVERLEEVKRKGSEEGREDPTTYRDRVFRSRLGGEVWATEPPVPWMKGDEREYEGLLAAATDSAAASEVS